MAGILQTISWNAFSCPFIPMGPIDNKSVLVQVMAWCRTSDKPISEPMLSQFTDAYMWHWGEMSWYSIVDLMICPWYNWFVFVIKTYPSCADGMYIMIHLTLWILTHLPPDALSGNWVSIGSDCLFSAKPLHQPLLTLIASFMGPTWGSCGADRTHVGSMNFAIWGFIVN